MIDYSVVIPTFNRQSSLLKSVYSCLGQTIPPVEVIIVDDNSTDNTGEIISKFTNNCNSTKIRYYRNSSNKGACYSRNRGVNLSKSSWIAFNDSDDVWLPNKIEKLAYNLLSYKQEVSCLASSFFDVKNDYDIKYNPVMHSRGNNSTQDSDFIVFSKQNLKNLLVENCISTQTLLIRKDCFCQLDGFDESLPRFQDWEFIIRILASGNTIVLDPSPLVLAFKSSDSITRNFSAGLSARKYIFEKHKDLFESFKLSKFKYILAGFIRAVVSRDFESSKYFLLRLLF